MAREFGLRDGAFQNRAQDAGLRGLFQIPERAGFAHDLDGFLDAAEGCENDGRRRRGGFLQFREQGRCAIQVRHIQIGDNRVGGKVAEFFEGIAAIAGGLRFVAPAGQQMGHGGALALIVVDDQDPPLLGWGCVALRGLGAGSAKHYFSGMERFS